MHRVHIKGDADIDIDIDVDIDTDIDTDSYYGGCQNHGPFLGPIIIRHLVLRDPKRDHNFDNHPYV